MSRFIVPGVAFAVVSSPATYKLTRGIAGSWIASAEGVASPAGLFLHTLVFLFVLFLLRKYLPKVFPRMSMYGHMMGGKYGKGEHETHRSVDDTIEGSPLMD
jgi:uncharacterized membrane protein YhiD involved in acid resistance